MITALTWRLGLAVVAWWALADSAVPEGAGWVVAAVGIAGAAGLSLALRRPGARRPRPSRLPRVLVFFARQSVAGGIDVGLRALLPRGVVRPGFIEYTPSLAEGTPRAVFMEMVSVMPGTLVVREEDDGVLLVHVIDTRMPTRQSLERLERELDRLFAAT